jgi:hypothetical protein
MDAHPLPANVTRRLNMINTRVVTNAAALVCLHHLTVSNQKDEVGKKNQGMKRK